MQETRATVKFCCAGTGLLTRGSGSTQQPATPCPSARIPHSQLSYCHHGQPYIRESLPNAHPLPKLPICEIALRLSTTQATLTLDLVVAAVCFAASARNEPGVTRVTLGLAGGAAGGNTAVAVVEAVNVGTGARSKG